MRISVSPPLSGFNPRVLKRVREMWMAARPAEDGAGPHRSALKHAGCVRTKLAFRFLVGGSNPTVTLDDQLDVVSRLVIWGDGVTVLDHGILAGVIACQR